MGAGLAVDDGGSTRIKWMKQEEDEPIVGKMRTIMTVREAEGKGRSTQEIENDPYNKIRIIWLDKFGNPNLRDFNFSEKSILRITSHLQQNVEVQNTGTGLKISLYGDLVEPVVEARQHELKRRYIVTNSGHIEKVTVDSQVYYDVTTIVPPENQPVIYTSVLLT